MRKEVPYLHLQSQDRYITYTFKYASCDAVEGYLFLKSGVFLAGCCISEKY